MDNCRKGKGSTYPFGCPKEAISENQATVVVEARLTSFLTCSIPNPPCCRFAQRGYRYSRLHQLPNVVLGLNSRPFWSKPCKLPSVANAVRARCRYAYLRLWQLRRAFEPLRRLFRQIYSSPLSSRTSSNRQIVLSGAKLRKGFKICTQSGARVDRLSGTPYVYLLARDSPTRLSKQCLPKNMMFPSKYHCTSGEWHPKPQ